jgi:hypothetical protein
LLRLCQRVIVEDVLITMAGGVHARGTGKGEARERESAGVSGGASGEAGNACCRPTHKRKSEPRRSTRQQWWSALSRMAATKAFPQTPGGRGRAQLRIQILAYSVEIRISSVVTKLLLS